MPLDASGVPFVLRCRDTSPCGSGRHVLARTRCRERSHNDDRPRCSFSCSRVVGLMIGSFLNVCIGRLPAGESIVAPGSRCPACRTPIRWYDNIPVVSYLALGGRCRACRAPIGIRYPLVEIGTALRVCRCRRSSSAATWRCSPSRLVLHRDARRAVRHGPRDAALAQCRSRCQASSLGLRGQRVAAAGLDGQHHRRRAWRRAFCGAVRWGWKAATGVDGMGLGDVKMLAMIGAFLGWHGVVVTLFLASLGGAVVGVMLDRRWPAIAPDAAAVRHVSRDSGLRRVAWWRCVAPMVSDALLSARALATGCRIFVGRLQNLQAPKTRGVLQA